MWLSLQYHHFPNCRYTTIVPNPYDLRRKNPIPLIPERHVVIVLAQLWRLSRAVLFILVIIKRVRIGLRGALVATVRARVGGTARVGSASMLGRPRFGLGSLGGRTRGDDLDVVVAREVDFLYNAFTTRARHC